MNDSSIHTILTKMDSDSDNDLIADVKNNLEPILEMMEEYLQEHYSIISDPNFENIFVSDLMKLFGTDHMSEDDAIDMEFEIHDALIYFYSAFMPRRSFNKTFTYKEVNIEDTTRHIDYLKSIPQPVQRTPEWYEYRHNLITASDLYKAVDSQSMKNSLIYSKCNTLKTLSPCVSLTSSLHWGQKYEPLSIMLYEYIYKTEVSELGCIPHNKYRFIGASPDGINTCKESQRYGRLLEIKNVVSREITGEPKKEYWIQMQAQMEVCDINDCDFLETKFTEYDCYNSYINDDFEIFTHDKPQSITAVHSLVNKEDTADDTDDYDDDDDEYSTQCKYPFKGLIMMFINELNDKIPIYVYKPLNITIDEEHDWEETVFTSQKEQGNSWVRNIYWKLEVFSCVLVLRNKFWFDKSVREFEFIWDTIEKERVSGFSHRAPKKRNNPNDIITVLK